jgi:uncharacterized protein (UPF0332 family)
MSLHADLLAQARRLVSQDPRRPRQASLRRAISTAYYALFHLLISEASAMLVSDASHRLLVSRTFTHAEMQKASRSFAGGTLPAKFASVTSGVPVPAQLRNVAQAFADLQQLRHDADYNLAKTFTRDEARRLIEKTEQAFADWQSVRKSDHANLYLSCLLLWERFERIR